MREAIGSTWLTGIIITFIAIFAGFLAFSISYTKSFRDKNQILNIIVQKEGYNSSKNNLRNVTESQLKDDNSTEAEIFKYIKALGYNYAMFDNKTNPCKEGKLKEGGYCVVRYVSNTGAVNYKVTTYVSLSIPVLGISLNIPISGETKTVYYDNSNCDCDA